MPSQIMLKPLIIISFLPLSIYLLPQINYKGFIDKYPIELVTLISSYGDVKAIYAYQKYNEPIVINGRQNKDTLIFYEKGKHEKVTATLTFQNFHERKTL